MNQNFKGTSHLWLWHHRRGWDQMCNTCTFQAFFPAIQSPESCCILSKKRWHFQPPGTSYQQTTCGNWDSISWWCSLVSMCIYSYILFDSVPAQSETITILWYSQKSVHSRLTKWPTVKHIKHIKQIALCKTLNLHVKCWVGPCAIQWCQTVLQSWQICHNYSTVEASNHIKWILIRQSVWFKGLC